MLGWLEKRATVLQALSAIGALIAVVGGIVGIKVQLEASARLQKEQSARDIYREFLNLSITQPKLASPDFCAIVGTADEAAYDNYLNYLLYTSEQVLAALPEWDETMMSHLDRHKEAICGEGGWEGEAPEVRTLIGKFKTRQCSGFKSACSSREEVAQ
jgi:hypothetical protein